MNPSPICRPSTLRDVAAWSDSIQAFGSNLRDWQHTVQRGGIHSRAALSRCIAAVPPLLVDRFPQGDVADAYLAAYAEWVADRAGVPRPDWCADPRRVARQPWFSSPTRAWLLVQSPGSFRQRNLFTAPEPVFVAKPGRPSVPPEQKREKARLRQQAYRKRVGSLLAYARAAQTSMRDD